MKDERAIAFITCVNDEAWYAECLLYLRHLRLPEGFRAEYIAVRGASSMAAGALQGLSASGHLARQQGFSTGDVEYLCR